MSGFQELQAVPADVALAFADEGDNRLPTIQQPAQGNLPVPTAPARPETGGSRELVEMAKLWPRNEERAMMRIAKIAARVGKAYYYSWRVNKKGGGTALVEGPSIKLANDLIRYYGNLKVDTRVFAFSDHWMIYARVIDLEAVTELVRPFQQAKPSAQPNMGIKTDDYARREQMALAMGVSKAIRNVVVNYLQTLADYGVECAKGALHDKIGKRMDYWHKLVLDAYQTHGVPIARVERVIGKVNKNWNVDDIAQLVGELTSIKDGFSAVEEIYPPEEEEAKPDAQKAEPAKRTRRTKAEMEAARKAKAAEAEQGAVETKSQSGAQSSTAKSADEGGEKQPVENREKRAATPFDVVDWLGEVEEFADVKGAEQGLGKLLEKANKVELIYLVWENNEATLRRLPPGSLKSLEAYRDQRIDEIESENESLA